MTREANQRQRLRRPTSLFRFFILVIGLTLACLFIGLGARVLSMGRWASGVCGEWASAGWREDSRCDGSLDLVERSSLTAARVGGVVLLLTSVWLATRSNKRPAKPELDHPKK
jgi:hypothetical protein